jgi:outer membrane protein TolC
MKRSIFIIILISFSISIFAQEQLTMQDAIEKALANNYSIQMVKKQKEIARKNVTLGNAGILPFE